MERLTERANDEFDGIYVKDHDYITASHKLADYEDGEENGLLARLPYKVGNDVWSSEPFKDDKIWHYILNRRIKAPAATHQRCVTTDAP